MMLVKLTPVRGAPVYLNADKILSVHPLSYATGDDGRGPAENGAIVYHEPYNRENSCDWTHVKETPEQIIELTQPPIASGRFGE